jgi:hypothetical protein
MASYATVEDYELRSGTDIPEEEEPMIQVRLDDYSTLMEVYMGPCAEYVEAAYPDILTSLVCTAVNRSFSVTPGIRSESIASTSVVYDTGSVTTAGLYPNETEVLDALMAACCPLYTSGNQVGQVGAAYDREREYPPPDEAWVLSRW